MFEKLKQKIKHELAERKEAREAYKAAQKEEGLRVQHLSMQKKMELKKQRMASAKIKGMESKHNLEKLKAQANKIKESPALKMFMERAKQELKRQIVGRPARKKKRKRKHKRY